MSLVHVQTGRHCANRPSVSTIILIYEEWMICFDSIFDSTFDGSYNKNCFWYRAFWWKSFHVLTRRGKGLNHDLIFGTFIGRFLSDVTASMAAKGLKSQSQTKYDHKENTQSHIFWSLLLFREHSPREPRETVWTGRDDVSKQGA